ncbi:MAG: TadE/TadG family type IV pilus assembly protein, partial [Solirubrobacteraceae bacterium]
PPERASSGGARRPVARRWRAQDGQAAVEFALILPVLLLIITAILQFGGMYNNYITLTDSVRTGVRTLAIGRGSSDPCDAAVTQTVNSAIGVGLSASAVTTTITGTTGDTCGSGSYPNRTGVSMAAGDQATVSAKSNYSVNIFGLPLITVPLTATANEAVE